MLRRLREYINAESQLNINEGKGGFRLYQCLQVQAAVVAREKTERIVGDM
jgi:hypothetical protein